MQISYSLLSFTFLFLQSQINLRKWVKGFTWQSALVSFMFSYNLLRVTTEPRSAYENDFAGEMLLSLPKKATTHRLESCRPNCLCGKIAFDNLCIDNLESRITNVNFLLKSWEPSQIWSSWPCAFTVYLFHMKQNPWTDCWVLWKQMHTQKVQVSRPKQTAQKARMVLLVLMAMHSRKKKELKTDRPG